MNTLIVKINKSKTRWPYLRPQQWYWTISSLGNNEVLARSEMFVNRQDCVDSAKLANDDQANVSLKQPNLPLESLRFAAIGLYSETNKKLTPVDDKNEID